MRRAPSRPRGGRGTSHSPWDGAPDGDGDTDADTDADSDTDADGDSDADSDSDVDADGDLELDGDRPLECGDTRPMAPRRGPPPPIINGTDHWDPGIVALTEGQALAVGAILGQYEGEWYKVCSATVIAPDAVLTAAHCFYDWTTLRWITAPEVRFAVGHDAATPELVFEPTSVNVHPEWDFWSMDIAFHDVAVLLFDRPLTDDLPGLAPIAANCDALAPDELVGTWVQLVGHGMTALDDPSNSRRWWTTEEVTALSDADLTVDGRGVTGICYGDSGGPALRADPATGQVRVIGTASWGEESCVDTDHYALTDFSCPFIEGFIDVDHCGGESYEGRCNGDTAVYCDGDRVVVLDCGSLGMDCGRRGELVRCVDRVDPCGGETSRGRCESGRAVWCEGGEVLTVDCAAEGLLCGVDGAGRNRCIAGPCRGITEVGRCIVGSAMWCDEGQIRACSQCGQACGWSEAHRGIYSID